jgi:hypothetical protein
LLDRNQEVATGIDLIANQIAADERNGIDVSADRKLALAQAQAAVIANQQNTVGVYLTEASLLIAVKWAMMAFVVAVFGLMLAIIGPIVKWCAVG